MRHPNASACDSLLVVVVCNATEDGAGPVVLGVLQHAAEHLLRQVDLWPYGRHHIPMPGRVQKGILAQ